MLSTDNNLPNQKIPLSKKNESWKKTTVDYFERMSRVTNTGNRSSNYKKLVNYELFNGRFNKEDLEYVVNPLGAKDMEFPATLQHYDIISPAIMLLLGEESKRPDNQMVVSEGPNDIDRKKDNIKNRIYESLIQEIQSEINPEEVDPNNPPQIPEHILKYEKYNTTDLIEVQSNKLLKVLKKHLDLKNVFKRGWKDALISGEEIYWTGIVNGEPVTRRVNPVDISVVLQNDSDYIDDAVAVTEVRLLPFSSVIDEFGDELKPSQIDELERISKSFYNTNFTNSSFDLNHQGISFNDTVSSSNQYRNHNGSIRVVRVEWKGMAKIGTLKYFDPEIEQSIEKTVTEEFNFNIFKEVYPDAEIEWFWITEAWEGTKLGNEIYINVRPKPNQRKRLDNPYTCKLGYTGMLYNATNSVSVSLIDRMKPYQYLYNILMYRLELAFASDMGKIMLMDLAQVPRSEGIDIEKWFYYLKSMKIGFINSFEESKKGQRTGAISQFNQFQSIDMTLANTIQQYISTLEYIKNQVAFLSGVSPQRLASINNNELVGNVEKSIEQSSYITEYWFDMHNEVKRRTYTALIECAKIAYREGLRRQYVLDDMGIELLEIDGETFENSEFSVYVSNTNKDFQIKESIKQLFQTALSADKADLSDIVEILQNDSIKELQHKLKANEERKAQRDMEVQQAQNEALQAQEQMRLEVESQKLALEERKLDIDEYKIEVDSQTKLRVAEIQSFAFQKDLDQNDNGIPDPMEVANLALEENKIMRDSYHKDNERKIKETIENKKINTQEKLEKEKMKLKEKELKSKEKIEKLKSDTAKYVAKTNRNKSSK